MEGSLISIKSARPEEATIELSIGDYCYEQINVEFTIKVVIASQNNLPHFHKIGQKFIINRNAKYEKGQRKMRILNFERNCTVLDKIERNCDALMHSMPVHHIGKMFSLSGMIVSYREPNLRMKDANYQYDVNKVYC